MNQKNQEWLEENLKDIAFKQQYDQLRLTYSEDVVIRKLKRKQWMAEAMQQYAASDVEKFWEAIDGEDFKGCDE